VTARALILAAGQGTRLRPHTDLRPKCLVALLGKPLLEWQEMALTRAGIRDLTIVGGYRAELIEVFGYRVIRNPNFERSNMVSSLFCAREIMQSGQDLLVAYGDIVYEPRLIIELLRSAAPVAVMVDSGWREYWQLRFQNPLSDAETLKLSPDNRLLELGQKPQSYEEIEAQYMGLIKIRADQLSSLMRFYDDMDRNASYDGKDFDNMFMTSFIQCLINRDWHVQAVPVKNGWLEVDSVTDLALYASLHAQGKLARFYRLPV
jgi:choline kinase